jgi:tripartite-type tricarboxylate transporter receptor subunit TctC
MEIIDVNKARRTLLGATAGVIVPLICPVAGLAQGTYPNRPIRLLIGFPPGGGNDVVARVVGPRLSAALGQQVVLENRPGATGTIAANLVAKSTPDGYTLLEGAVSTNVIANYLYKDLPYDPEKDLIPVTLLASIPQLIAVNRALPVNTLQELIAYAKANPGTLNFGSAGNGSTPHIAGEIFKARTGTDLRHVPYKGAGQSINDLLAGRLQVSFDTTGTIITHIRSGALRALAIAAPNRFAPIADVPTTAEAGLPDFEISTWIGVFAPAGTPSAIVALLNDRIVSVLRQPEVRKQLVDSIGSDESMTATPLEFARLIQRDAVKYGSIIKQAGIHLD